ncbi:hypothetical protein ACEPPN_015247 [Leptodophora sp. 'Broadleaf-Isolate-01']
MFSSSKPSIGSSMSGKVRVAHGLGTSGTEPFPYVDLDSSKKEIRLVTILPAKSPTIQVACELSHGFSGDPLKYEALSYCWGSIHNPIAILLDNREFYVTRNLHEALCQFRLQDKPRTLWIDAICINQQSIPERNSQVLLMRTIYIRSSTTLIWIGPAFKDSDKMMDFISLEDKRLLDPTIDGGDEAWAAARYARAMEDPLLKPVWVALLKLCQQPYWFRMWIVQEAVFGTAPQICVGSKSASFFGGLTRVLSSLSAERELEALGMPPNDIWDKLLADNKPQQIGFDKKKIDQPKDLRWLVATLIRYRSSLATDPRDKIISLLGFLDESGARYDQFVTVDYSRPVLNFCLDIFKFCLNDKREATTVEQSVVGTSTRFTADMTFKISQEAVQAAEAEGRDLDVSDWQLLSQLKSRPHGVLNILTAAGYRNMGVDGFPSWLPHWGQPSTGQSIDDLSCNRFTASGTSEPTCVLLVEPSFFQFFGFPVGHISYLGDKHRNLNPSRVELVHTVASWYLLGLSHQRSPEWEIREGSPSRRSEFWRTLVFDSYIDRNFFSAPDEWKEMNLDWLIAFVESTEKPGMSRRMDPDDLINELMTMLLRTTHGRRFALAASHACLMVPEEAEKGDVVVVVLGCDIPLLLRRSGDRWLLIGDCFCFGMMEGEVLQAIEQGILEGGELFTLC